MIVCLAGLGVMLPLLLLPYAAEGHDFFHHILRLIALDQQVNLGDAFPLRFPDYSHGYGLATLSYYPPLAYLLMETVHLLGANYLLAYQVTLSSSWWARRWPATTWARACSIARRLWRSASPISTVPIS